MYKHAYIFSRITWEWVEVNCNMWFRCFCSTCLEICVAVFSAFFLNVVPKRCCTGLGYFYDINFFQLLFIGRSTRFVRWTWNVNNVHWWKTTKEIHFILQFSNIWMLACHLVVIVLDRDFVSGNVGWCAKGLDRCEEVASFDCGRWGKEWG